MSCDADVINITRQDALQDKGPCIQHYAHTGAAVVFVLCRQAAAVHGFPKEV